MYMILIIMFLWMYTDCQIHQVIDIKYVYENHITIKYLRKCFKKWL